MKFPPYCLQPLPHESRANACKAIMAAPDGYWVTIQDETRTLEQNRLLWPLLTLWAKNQKACVNGQMIPLSREGWKVVHLADFLREDQEEPNTPQFVLTPGGQLIPLESGTRALGKHRFARLLTYLLAETGNRGMELPPRAVEECQDYIKTYSKEKAA